MKTLVMLISLLLFPSLGWAETPMQIHIIFQNNTGQPNVVIEMFDTPASHDFMALLPLTLEFSDFARTEKIAYLPRRLNTAGTPTALEAQNSGDFSYYAPWGNLAVFYKGFANDGQIYTLGRILSGKDALASMRGDFTATIQRNNAAQ